MSAVFQSLYVFVTWRLIRERDNSNENMADPQTWAVERHY